MEKKFLPIGSICTLKGKNKKVMVTGYCGLEFNGNLKIDDYVGCTYPEGMLLPELVCNFNHSEIEKVDFIGFKNEEYQVFSNLLDKLIVNNESNEESYKTSDWVLASNKSYSKLLFDENGVVVLAEPTIVDSNLKNKIKFDENGIVVADDNDKVKNPFYRKFEPSSDSANDNSSDNIFNKYKFNEDGVVVGENLNDIEGKEFLLNKIEFDENKNVINVPTNVSDENVSKYKFDENGILIEINNDIEQEILPIEQSHTGNVKPENQKVSNYSFDENGNLVSEETYEFDANGNLVSLNKNELEKEEKTSTIGTEVSGDSDTKNEVKYNLDENENVISDSIPLNSTQEEESDEVPATPNYQFDENGILISA